MVGGSWNRQYIDQGGTYNDAGNDVAGRALLVLGATPGAIGARVACGVIQIP